MVVDAKDFAENTGALEYRHNYEFICSYHRRRKQKEIDMVACALNVR